MEYLTYERIGDVRNHLHYMKGSGASKATDKWGIYGI